MFEQIQLNTTLKNWLGKLEDVFPRRTMPHRLNAFQPAVLSKLLKSDEIERIVAYANATTLDLFDTRPVHHVDAGEQPSATPGRGIEFEELRRYQVGDEPRDIDWGATLRRGHPYVRVRHEEKRARLQLVVDRGARMRFATRGELKVSCAASLALLFAHCAARAGAQIFLSTIETNAVHHHQTANGLKPAELISHVIAPCPPEKQLSEISWTQILEGLSLSPRAGTLVVILSDFADLQAADLPSLSTLSYSHRVIPVRISDPVEQQLPNIGRVRFTDPGSGKQMEIDTGDKNVRTQFTAQRSVQREFQTNLFHRAGISLTDLSTDEDVFNCFERIVNRV